MRLKACGVVLLSSTLAVYACRSKSEPTPTTKASSAAPAANELPPITIKSDTANLLLTWIDDHGDFHVVQKPGDVPAEGRKSVRVVMVEREEGTGKLVYVADLTETAPDGSYRVKTMSRSSWDELGASRRKARLEALAPSAVAPPSSAPGTPPKPGTAALGSIAAVIYGASWCKPCHEAQAYLKSRGVNVVMKDIDESDAAKSEMQRKLERAGLGGSSIPVIDLMGQILIGYSPRALDRAIEAARAAKPL